MPSKARAFFFFLTSHSKNRGAGYLTHRTAHLVVGMGWVGVAQTEHGHSFLRSVCAPHDSL